MNELTELINKLESKINIELSSDMTESQKYYISGLSDALEIIKERENNMLKVGKIYYVIMYKNNKRSMPYIQRMILYKITFASKDYYCFSDDLKPHTKYKEASLVLSSKRSILIRVFDTFEKANERIM